MVAHDAQIATCLPQFTHDNKLTIIKELALFPLPHFSLGNLVEINKPACQK
jgi:hypothetical protein